MLLDLNPDPHSYYWSGAMTDTSMRIDADPGSTTLIC
jgi:hypothetical protein